MSRRISLKRSAVSTEAPPTLCPSFLFESGNQSEDSWIVCKIHKDYFKSWIMLHGAGNNQNSFSSTRGENDQIYWPTVETGDLASSWTSTVSARTSWTLGTTVRMERMSKAYRTVSLLVKKTWKRLQLHISAAYKDKSNTETESKQSYFSTDSFLCHKNSHRVLTACRYVCEQGYLPK